MKHFSVFVTLEERRLYTVFAANEEEAKERAHLDFEFSMGSFRTGNPQLVTYRTKVMQEVE